MYIQNVYDKLIYIVHTNNNKLLNNKYNLIVRWWVSKYSRYLYVFI